MKLFLLLLSFLPAAPSFAGELVLSGVFYGNTRRMHEEALWPSFGRSGERIVLKNFDSGEVHLQRALEASRRGEFFSDVYFLDVQFVPVFARLGLLEEIWQIVGEAVWDLPPAYVEAARIEGKTLAVPFELSADLLLYNEREIRPSELPDSYEELLSWAKKNPGRYSYRGSGESLTTSLVNFLYAFGAVPDNPLEIFDRKRNPAILKTFEYLKRLYPHVRQPLYSNYALMDRDLSSGRLAFFSNWDSRLSRMRSAGAPVRVHPGVQLKGKDGKRPICMGGHFFALSSKARNPALAKAYLRFLLTPKAQALGVGKDFPPSVYTGHLPARGMALELMPPSLRDWFDVSDLKKMEGLKRTAFRNFVRRPSIPYYPVWSLLLQRAHNDIVVRGFETEKVLDSLDEELRIFAGSS